MFATGQCITCVFSVCVLRVCNACMPICALIRNFGGRIRNFVMRSEIRNNYEFSVIVGSSLYGISRLPALIHCVKYTYVYTVNLMGQKHRKIVFLMGKIV